MPELVEIKEADVLKAFRARLAAAFRCWTGRHHIPPKSAVTEMGAVFAGGMCTRCFRVKVGTFICNIWDDAQTDKEAGVIRLRGINPILTQGDYVVMDLDGLQEVAAEKRARRRAGK